MGFLHAADLLILHAVNGLSAHWSIDYFVNYAANDRNLTGFIFIIPYWYFWFQESPDQVVRLRRDRLLLAGLLSGLLAIVVARLMANLLPFRIRPFFDPTSGFVATALERGNGSGDFETWSSFPSDTAAFTFAVSFGIYRVNRRLSLALLGYAFIVACLFRVYLGVHYPSDVLVGAIIGIGSAMACQSIVPATWASVAERWTELQPGPFYTLAFLATAEMAQMFDNVRGFARALLGAWKALH